MKSKYFLLVLFICFLGTGYSQQLFIFEFAGTGACPTQNNIPTIAPPSSIIVTPPTRVGSSLVCASTSDWFSTTGFSGPDINLSNNYIDLKIEAAAGYYLNISSFSFQVYRSGTVAPISGRVAHNSTGAFTTYTEFPILTTSGLINWTSFSPFTVPPGQSVTFRFYAWNSALSAPGAGQLKLDNIAVYGSITTVPLTGLWASSAVNDIYNTNTANIGIGTTTPQAKLDVNGNIFTNGKLLIGTTNLTPLTDYSLAVNGNAIFNKVKVKLYSTGWPDYVFDEDYDLPSLSKVEAYLKQYRHLPGIPTASCINKNGIDVGDNQALLLKKVEELTLYVIELNKKIEALSNENKTLGDKVNSLTNIHN